MQCFAIYFGRLLLRKTKLIALGLDTGVSVPNDVSCSGDALFSRRLRCPDGIIYKGYLEFTREFLLLFALLRQNSDISVDRMFLHPYLELMSVAITDRAQVAQMNLHCKLSPHTLRGFTYP